ncbi:unnamed protein product [Penicillium viridicatum]
MATVATKTATPVMPPSFSMSQDISRAMTASNQKTEKTRSILIDGMPPAPPPSPVAFSKGKTCYNNIPSLSLDLEPVSPTNHLLGACEDLPIPTSPVSH